MPLCFVDMTFLINGISKCCPMYTSTQAYITRCNVERKKCGSATQGQQYLGYFVNDEASGWMTVYNALYNKQIIIVNLVITFCIDSME